MMSAAPHLIAEGVSVRLSNRAILESVSLDIAPGKVTAIVGPNGAGKSTLLACLAGLQRPAAGVVRLGAAPVLNLSPRLRARAIGLLPQSPEIAWDVDVRTLVGLGRLPFGAGLSPGSEDAAVVDRALEATGLTAMASRRVFSLSGGERARALIARALAGAPQWLLADEPLTGLDIGHQLEAAELLRTFARAGGGVILTIHDLAFAIRVADHLLLMDQGCIAASGPPAEVLTSERLAAVYGVSAAWVQTPDGPLLQVHQRVENRADGERGVDSGAALS